VHGMVLDTSWAHHWRGISMVWACALSGRESNWAELGLGIGWASHGLGWS
jgi:hypothetical protein